MVSFSPLWSFNIIPPKRKYDEASNLTNSLSYLEETDCPSYFVRPVSD